MSTQSFITMGLGQRVSGKCNESEKKLNFSLIACDLKDCELI